MEQFKHRTATEESIDNLIQLIKNDDNESIMQRSNFLDVKGIEWTFNYIDYIFMRLKYAGVEILL